MFYIEPDKNVTEFTKAVVGETNFGNRGKADGSKEQQYVGILGENMLRDFVGVELNGGGGTHDGGFDIHWYGQKTDIKTVGRSTDPKPHFAVNFYPQQRNADVDRYIFTSLNAISKRLAVCGWMPKVDFFNAAEYLTAGAVRYQDNGKERTNKYAMYELPVGRLYTLREDDLVGKCDE